MVIWVRVTTKIGYAELFCGVTHLRALCVFKKNVYLHYLLKSGSYELSM